MFLMVMKKPTEKRRFGVLDKGFFLVNIVVFQFVPKVLKVDPGILKDD